MRIVAAFVGVLAFPGLAAAGPFGELLVGAAPPITEPDNHTYSTGIVSGLRAGFAWRRLAVDVAADRTWMERETDPAFDQPTSTRDRLLVGVRVGLHRGHLHGFGRAAAGLDHLREVYYIGLDPDGGIQTLDITDDALGLEGGAGGHVDLAWIGRAAICVGAQVSVAVALRDHDARTVHLLPMLTVGIHE